MAKTSPESEFNKEKILFRLGKMRISKLEFILFCLCILEGMAMRQTTHECNTLLFELQTKPRAIDPDKNFSLVCPPGAAWCSEGGNVTFNDPFLED